MLDALIVLGLIPGTKFQITFDLWLAVLTCVSSLITLRRTYHSQALQRGLITSSVFVMTHRQPNLTGL